MENITFKDLLINLDLKLCYLNNKELPLTKNEFNLLVFLIQNKNKIYSRKELIQNVWEKEVALRTVDTVISRLKKKLGDISIYIRNRTGFGFGFITE